MTLMQILSSLTQPQAALYVAAVTGFFSLGLAIFNAAKAIKMAERVETLKAQFQNDLEHVKADLVRSLERMKLQERVYSDDLSRLLEGHKELMATVTPLRFTITSLNDMPKAIESQHEWRKYYDATLAVFVRIHVLLDDDLGETLTQQATKTYEVSTALQKFLYEVAPAKNPPVDVIDRKSDEVQEAYIDFQGMVSRCIIAQIKRIRQQRAEIVRENTEPRQS